MKTSWRLFHCVVFGFIALILGGPRPAQAVGFQPISPDELKMTSEPQAPGAPAVILYRQVDRDDNGYTSHEDRYYRIKILTEEGRKYANVEIPFFKEDQDITNIHARTIKANGSSENFDGKVFERPLMRSRRSGLLVKAFTFLDVQAGDLLEYYYTVDYGTRRPVQQGELRFHYIYGSEWIVSEELFTKQARFSLKPYSVNIPGRIQAASDENFSLRWTWHDLPAGATPKQGPDHIVRMEANNVPAFRIEDHMPPEEEMQARVDFIYDFDFTGHDVAGFWQHWGKKQNERVESFVGHRKAMEEAVAQIVSPGDGPELKLRKIYDKVQQMRNTSYELQKTEQETKRANEKKEDNVEDVWERGYGTGQQLTWLYLALARAAGFEAYGCLVSNRRTHFFSPNSMEPGRLDSNVVQLKVDGKDRYFDPGGAFTPFGMLMWAETAAPGLRLDKNGGTWIQTTLPKSAESEIERSGKLKLSENGSLEGKLTITYTGLEAMQRRLEERHADEVARKKFLEDEATSQVAAAAEVELTNKPDWSSSEAPLVAEFDLKVPGWVASAGKRAVFPAGLFSGEEKGMFEHATRVQPIYFEHPFEEVDDVTVELPTGWEVNSVPTPQNVDGHIVTYSTSVENGKNTLHLSRKLTVDILILDAKYYDALRDFFQRVKGGDEAQILLQPNAATASN